MIVKSLELNNFRTFYGSQRIDFSIDEDKNVTLIHGENGVGKTTLLNAILWCLFEDTTRNFERPSELLNHEAAAEGIKSYSVSIRFIEEDEGEYEVRRGCDFQGKSYFQAFKVVEGNFEPIPNPYNLVNGIIPKDMAHYFFFHGEGVSSVEKAQVMRDAIRDVLGLSIAETALNDIDEIKKKVRREASRHSPDVGLHQIEERIIQTEQRLEKRQSEHKELAGHIERKKQQIEQLDKDLRDLPNARELQQQREKAESEANRWKRVDRDCDQQKADFISRKGWAVFGSQLAREAEKYIDQEMHRGGIPKPY